MGDIIVLEDVNARTNDEQTTMFDTNEAVYGRKGWSKATSSRYECYN